MAAFPSPQAPAQDIPIFDGRGCTLLELSQLKWAAGRSAARAPTTSASAGTSQSKDCPIARGTRASRIGRSVGSAAPRVREHTTAAAPPSSVMNARLFIRDLVGAGELS